MSIEKRGYKLSVASETFTTTDVLDDFRDAMHLQIKAATVGLVRRELSRTETPPTAEEVAEYARLKAMLDEIEASDLWMFGHDEGYLREPEPTVKIVWDETEDEFRARVEAAYAAFMRDPGAFLRPRTIPATFRAKESCEHL